MEEIECLTLTFEFLSRKLADQLLSSWETFTQMEVLLAFLLLSYEPVRDRQKDGQEHNMAA